MVNLSEGAPGGSLAPPAPNVSEQTSATRTALLESISHVGTIAPQDIQTMVAELAPHFDGAATNYEEYQNGGWKLLALYNNSGDPQDTTVREHESIRATELLDSMPTVRRVINSFFPEDRIVLARVARFMPGGRLWEHVDYTELDQDTPRLRFHIPLVTEPEAVFVTAGHRVHMGLGNLWMINPRGAHGIVHTGQQDRVHIIIDATVDETLALNAPGLDAEYVAPLEPLSPEEVTRQICRLSQFIVAGETEFAEDQGLNMFYRWRLPEDQTTHLAVAAAYQQAGDEAGYQRWLKNNNLYMHGGLKHD